MLRKLRLNKHIEFVAQLPLEQAAKRLAWKNTSAKFFFLPNPLRVTVTPIDAETYQFKIARDLGRNINVEVVGTLQRSGDYTTWVTANGQISRVVLMLIPVSAVLVFCTLWISPHTVACFFGFPALGLVAIALEERNRLIDSLAEIMDVARKSVTH